MRRWVSWSLILSVFAFVGLGALSLWLYPGGNAFNRHTQGYHFWHNFICDALAPRAIDGTPNILGSRVGIAAMGAIALPGLAVLWGWVPRLLRARRWIVWLVRVSGMMAILGLLLMFGEAFMKMPLSHHVLVLSAATPGIIATSVVLAVSFRHRLWPLWFHSLGVAMIAACIVNFVLYIRLHIGWDHLTPMLPTSQKWAMGFVLLWLLGLGILLQRR